MEQQSGRFTISLSKLFGGVLAIAVIAAGGFAGYKYIQAEKKINYLTSLEGRSQLEKEEAAALLAEVGKHIVLPDGEEPVVATINDIEALVKEAPFYSGAENGDKVLIYEKAAKAIIYSVKKQKLVNVGPVVADPKAGQTNGQVAGDKTTPTPRTSPVTTPAR